MMGRSEIPRFLVMVNTATVLLSPTARGWSAAL
jgi:hypothetical protein